MLSQATLVKVRKSIEKGYTHSCSITVKEEYKKPNGSSGFRDTILIENQPCRLSFSSSKTADNESVSSATQTIKLFIAPEISIPPGSKIMILHDGIETEFAQSGQPATYPTHQEIMLVIKEDKA